MKENLISFQIGFQLDSNFALRVPYNLSFLIFMSNKLIQYKNWILIKV